jgi:NADPH:quinone reductase-like Zn-dependent oxidoreductase
MPKVYVYVAYGGPENQQFTELPRPVPGEGQLLVRVRAAGVNPADWKQRSNFRRSPDPLPGPAPMGLEVAGVVEELGPQVSGYTPGDEVFGSVAGNGGFSEYSLVPTAICAHKPEAVPFEDAATLPVAAATAYDGVKQLALSDGETLLITGIGGGVGIAAAQIAVAGGAHVVGTASAAKKELVESVGATHVTYGDGVAARVAAAAPDGVDALYDMVGGEALREVAPLVANGKRIVSAGDFTTAEDFGGARVDRARNSAVLEIVAQMVLDGTLKPFVREVFPFDRVGEAIALVESGHATGKVVVEIS